MNTYSFAPRAPAPAVVYPDGVIDPSMSWAASGKTGTAYDGGDWFVRRRVGEEPSKPIEWHPILLAAVVTTLVGIAVRKAIGV